MDSTVNTRPLLQISESDSDFDEDPLQSTSTARRKDVVIKGPVTSWIPSDRYNISYIIFYMLGTIILLPWFFFVTAEEYWMYKFRPLSHNVTLTETGRSELQATFTSYMTMAATVPSTIFLIINPLIFHKISLNVRVISSLVCMLFFFIVTTVFVEINTDTWQYGFYILTMVVVILLNIGSAILQSAIFGVVGLFPSRYISGTVAGQALGGIMAAVAQIVSLWLGASPILSALVYFIMADVFLFTSILAYIFLSTTIFFKYYSRENPRHSGSIQYAPVTVDKDEKIVHKISYILIVKKIWVYGFSLWFCLFVMFTVYPAITVLIKPLNGYPKSLWNSIYFVPVITFLLYSLCDYTGRLLAGVFQRPEKRSWIVALISLMRVIFIPAFLFCNAQPRHNLPVLINSDWYYVAITIAFGLSNGYLTNITFISVPKIVAAHEQEVASAMLAACMGIGVACGSVISIAFVKML